MRTFYGLREVLFKRRTERAVRSAQGRRESTTHRQMTAGAPSLTVDELDRAVRRDSRRYDGAMELY